MKTHYSKNSDFNALVECLKNISIEAQRTDNHKLPFKSIAEFVLQYGCAFFWRKLPRKYDLKNFGSCSECALELAQKYPDHLIYVEGYTYMPTGHGLPTQYAWCSDMLRNVYDPARSNANANSLYYGVPIKLQYAIGLQNKSSKGSIDAWEVGWPMFYDDPALFLDDRIPLMY